MTKSLVRAVKACRQTRKHIASGDLRQALACYESAVRCHGIAESSNAPEWAHASRYWRACDLVWASVVFPTGQLLKRRLFEREGANA